MRVRRVRFSLRGLMILVALAGLAFSGIREWNKRYGPGAFYWQESRRMDHLARIDLRRAREYRDCPRDHTPWNDRFQCPGCIPCPTTPPSLGQGKPPDYIPNFLPDSAPGRDLTRRFLEQHEKVAREYEAEAATYRKLRDKFAEAADRAPDREIEMTLEEIWLRGGGTLSEKYQYDWY